MEKESDVNFSRDMVMLGENTMMDTENTDPGDQKKINETLCESRLSKEKRGEIQKEMTVTISRIEGIMRNDQGGSRISPELAMEIDKVLTQRGIETSEEWREYIRNHGKRWGGVSRHMSEAKSKRSEQWFKASTWGSTKRTSSTEQLSEEWSRSRLERQATAEQALDNSGGVASQQLASYLRAMACADPGVFRGSKNENFNEFVRRFKRKYEGVVKCEDTLLEILSDDHLGGRAKNMYKGAAQAGKRARIWGSRKRDESTAGRLRALTELRALKIRPNQDVADFCVAIESLGQQAYPEGNPEDRALEYAQILLSNLGDWPEHFQLVSALHKVEAHRAYDEIKQLALSIEQSKRMLSANCHAGKASWKNRSTQYRTSYEGVGLVQTRAWERQEPCGKESRGTGWEWTSSSRHAKRYLVIRLCQTQEQRV
ncbi:hypothetical protein COOONC_20906 [Cooperia oncophora]